MRRLVPLVLVVAGCDPHEYEYVPPERSCELVEVSSPALGSIQPEQEFRFDCGVHRPTLAASIALVDDAIWVLADGWIYTYESSFISIDFEDWRLHRIVDREAEEVRLADNWDSSSGVLVVDDHANPWLFGETKYPRSLWFAQPSKSTDSIERIPLEVEGIEQLGAEPMLAELSFNRAELGGEVPNIWFALDQARMWSSRDESGWFGQPALAVEAVDDDLATIGLDGAGRQLVYATRFGGDPLHFDEAEIWTFDGQSTTALGTFDSRGTIVQPIPSAHPTDPSHEHAAMLGTWSGVTVIWPETGESVAIPNSPTLDDPDCMRTSLPVATRTEDGRIWLAWVVVAAPGCSLPASEAPTLRLVEIEPTARGAREVMRLELDASHLDIQSSVVVAGLGLTSYADQLALVIADGPEDQRLHVIRVDVGTDPGPD